MPVSNIKLTGAQLARRMRAGAEDWLADEGDATLEEARDRAPMEEPLREDSGRFRAATGAEHEPGALRRSARRDDVERQIIEGVGELLVTVLSFGTPYGAMQHEGYWKSGPNAGAVVEHYSTPGTGPKYLEVPALARVPTMAVRAREHVHRRVREA